MKTATQQAAPRVWLLQAKRGSSAGATWRQLLTTPCVATRKPAPAVQHNARTGAEAASASRAVHARAPKSCFPAPSARGPAPPQFCQPATTASSRRAWLVAPYVAAGLAAAAAFATLPPGPLSNAAWRAMAASAARARASATSAASAASRAARDSADSPQQHSAAPIWKSQQRARTYQADRRKFGRSRATRVTVRFERSLERAAERRKVARVTSLLPARRYALSVRDALSRHDGRRSKAHPHQSHSLRCPSRFRGREPTFSTVQSAQRSRPGELGLRSHARAGGRGCCEAAKGERVGERHNFDGEARFLIKGELRAALARRFRTVWWGGALFALGAPLDFAHQKRNAHRISSINSLITRTSWDGEPAGGVAYRRCRRRRCPTASPPLARSLPPRCR